MDNRKVLEELLISVKGKVFKDFNLGKITFFKTGGNSEYFFIPKDITDLQYFLSNKPKNIPIFLIGNGSNLLVRDGGVKGVTIKLSNFINISLHKPNVIWAESGALDKNIAIFAKKYGLGGLEFLYTIPGTLGGAVVMNAGAYNAEIKDIFIKAMAITPEGKLQEVVLQDANFSYRSSIFKNNNNLIILGAYLQSNKMEDSMVLSNRMNLMEQKRLHTQPLASAKTGGSTFKNPHHYKAWELIQQVGGDTLKIGDAKVSSKHCNFLINEGNASAKDIEDLGELIRFKIKEKFNILLDWEIKIVGEFKK